MLPFLVGFLALTALALVLFAAAKIHWTRFQFEVTATKWITAKLDIENHRD